jgi:ABC-type Fe3+/spermidine/putrescine transport system ATPase subunit
MPVILDVAGLSKQFSANGINPVVVLQDICFSVRRGEMICFLGRSGCGKSTLLKILAGFLRPSSGAV